MVPRQILDRVKDNFFKEFPSGINILQSDPLGGGSINEVYRLKTSRGDYCLKYNFATSFPHMFETEALGLKLLAAPGVIRVPAVIFQNTLEDYSFLVLEYIHSVPAVQGFFREFGINLARLHRTKGDLFGLDYNNYMGSLCQNNCYHSGWVEFFTEERLEKQLGLAREKGLLDSTVVRRFDHLFSRLEELLPDEEPCLVHGDLWNGNFMVSETGKPCLIDPAVYFGNREIDLAMSTLFGGFDSSFYSAYSEEYPLIPGWRERFDIYNLYPLLIHLNLFGTSYLGSILRIIGKF